jgi:predicted MFS family arabinose efflux permease
LARAAAGRRGHRPHRTGLLLDRNFRLIGASAAISATGSQITVVALPLTALLVCHATSAEVGLLAALGYFPYLFVSPLAGVWVDQFSAKRASILSDLAQGCIVGAVPVIYLTGHLAMGVLYVLVIVNGCFTVTGAVAHSSLTPVVFQDKDKRRATNSMINVAYQTAEIVGPSSGGILVRALRAPVAIGFDAASFFISAAMMSAVRLSPAVSSRQDRQSWLVLMREGISYLRQARTVTRLALVSGSVNLFYVMYTTALLIHLVRNLHFPSSSIGIILGCGGIGGVAGAALAARNPRWLSESAAPALGLFLVAAGIGATELAQVLPAPALALLITAAGVFLVSDGTSFYNVHVISIRQNSCKPEMIGRVTAVCRMLTHCMLPPGAFLGGLLMGRIGYAPTAAIAAIAAIAMAVYLELAGVAEPDELHHEADLSETPGLRG